MASPEIVNIKEGKASQINRGEIGTERENLNTALKRILIPLSESGRLNFEKNHFAAVKDLYLMLWKNHNRNNDELTTTLWHEFIKAILTQLFCEHHDVSVERGESGMARSVQESQGKLKLLVKLILKHCAPFVKLEILLSHLQQTSNVENTRNLSIILGVLFHNCCNKEQHDQAVDVLIKLAQNPSISSKIHRLCICLACSLENKTMLVEAARDLGGDYLDVIARKLCNWLTNVSTHQPVATPQDKMKRPVTKRIVIQEIDGTSSRDIFTLLNLASAYKTEHMNNIHSFSMLQSWLLILQKYDAEVWNTIFKKISKPTRAATAIPRLVGQSSFYLASSCSSESSGPASLSSSLSSLHSFLFVENDNKDADESRVSSTYGTPPHSLNPDMQTPPSLYENASLHSSLSMRRPMSVSTPKRNPSETDLSIGSRKISSASLSSTGLTLKNASIRYCFRVLNQAERSPKRGEDKPLLEATVIEAVRILTILCQQDETLVKQVFPEIKRVHSRFLGKSSVARCLYPADIQFFVEHFDSMIYNTEELVNSYLNSVPSQLYTNPSACFEILDFCLRNATFLQRFPFLSRFFPNLLKIIAWHPRSFLYEILQLIPLFMCEETTCEVFHSILDLPCTSVMLELTQENILDQFLVENIDASLGESGSFLSKSHRTISDFFLRCESGKAETIDKLDKIFIALVPSANRTRITVCCQMVPILLQKYFECLINQANEKVQRQLFPSILERIFVIFPNAALQKGVRNMLSEQLVRICSLNPVFLSIHQDDILYVFKQMRSSCSGIEPVLASLVYCIGEFSIRPGVCSMEQIAKYYELIETLLYETKVSLFIMDDFAISAKLLSTLISAAGKLAAFSQDFVPKTVICLTKLAKTEWRMDSCRLNQREFDFVMSRASDIVNVLRLPNVSPAVLCSGADTEPWHLHKDSSRQLKIQAMARRQTLSPDGS